jgi:hypothetical protein
MKNPLHASPFHRTVAPLLRPHAPSCGFAFSPVRALLLGLLAWPPAGLFAQGAPSNIVVEVEAFSLAPTARPGPSLLKDVPGLLLRDQGSGGPQTDLSIRGGPFNSSGLLLNGLTLRNAQTEHFHADVPAPEAWFGAPAVLTGLDRFRAAPGTPRARSASTSPP